MEKNIKIVIVGLGRIGSTFLAKLVENKRSSVSIVAVAEIDPEAPGLKIARDNGIAVFDDPDRIVDMGEEVDVIFDLTGNIEARRSLRGGMVRTANTRTVIVPEVIASLIWELIAEGDLLPDSHLLKGY